MKPSDPLVVEVERSGLVESTHAVDAAVVRAGEASAWAGDPETVAFLRSSAKPVQALACVENGWRPPGGEQLAIACASHNAEPRHVEAVRLTLTEAGVPEDALRCPPAWPSLAAAAVAVSGPARVLHNCSGKHAAMLATASINGWALDSYSAPEHPMQRAAGGVVERLAGRRARHSGVDGCGVQTFAFDLVESARLFAALASSGREVLDAMAAHPFLVAGTGRLCTAVMAAVPGVAIKIGAEGLACGVLRQRDLGFALKSRDGTNRARDAATVALLEMLDVFPDGLPKELAPHASPAVEGGGRPAGVVRCRGSLKHA